LRNYSDVKNITRLFALSCCRLLQVSCKFES